MTSAKEYRQQAREFLELANAATDLYARVTLAELAQEFNQAADKLEQPLNPKEVRPRLPNPPKRLRDH